MGDRFDRTSFPAVFDPVTAHDVHSNLVGLPLARAALVEPLAVAANHVVLAARQRGARVTITEINRQRLRLARELGFDALDLAEVDVCAELESVTEKKGYDGVFVVPGTRAGVDLTAAAEAARGRTCEFAIHASEPRIYLFVFFWRELGMVGARVYGREDFDGAVEWLASGIGAERLITSVRPLPEFADAFHELSEIPGSMKTLIRQN